MTRDTLPSMPGLEHLVSLSEKELQRRIVEPLLHALGFRHVRDTSGPTEKGKDLIAIMNDSFGNPELFAIQLKKFRVTGKAQAASSLGGLFVQLRQALTEPVIDPLTNVKRPPDKVIFITPYEIPTHARDAFHEQSREPIYKALRLLDGRRILELLREHLPDALAQFSMETQYRLRVARATNEIPESAIAFQLRHELKLEEIWVEISIGPGDRSLHIIACEPLASSDKHHEAHATRNQVLLTIDRFRDWAGDFAPEDAILIRRSKAKGQKPSPPGTGRVWIDIDKLLERPRATVQAFLGDVQRLSDGNADVGAIIERGIRVLSGVSRLKDAYPGHGDHLVRSHGYQQSERSDAGQFLIA